MESDRKIAIVAGVLFLIAILAGILSVVFLGAFEDPIDLTKIADSKGQVLIGVLLVIIMSFACAGIGLSLYPVLRRYDEMLAIGSAGFRVIEGVIFLVATVGQLALLTLSLEFVKAGAPDGSFYQALGTLIYSTNGLALSLVGALAFCLGALLYYIVFYRSRLIPRWLAGWGIIAILMHMAYSLTYLFGGEPAPAVSAILNVPILLQEIVLAIWLIAKGFNRSAAVTRPTVQKQDIAVN